MNIEASFIRSAAGASDLPRDGLAEIVFVGRSNVGKSSLINALVRQRIARTSAAPGKTRLANVYRVARGQTAAMYLIDLPGYGFATGGSAGFEELAGEYFERGSRQGRERRDQEMSPAHPVRIGALLLVDARHPGLDNDRKAWTWLKETAAGAALVATKIDKLARGQRIRAMRQLESAFADSVLPVSAVTGEGLDELWKLIDSLANRPSRNNSSLSRPSRNNRLSRPSRRSAKVPAAMARPRLGEMTSLEKTTRALRPPRK